MGLALWCYGIFKKVAHHLNVVPQRCFLARMRHLNQKIWLELA